MTVTPLAHPVPAGVLPPGRGRWRLTLHKRAFDQSATISQTILAELTRARSRVLTQQWNTPAQLTFTLDGDDPAASLFLELATDVIAWRFDENQGADIPVFRGIVDHSADTLDEQSATVDFVCHDYLALLARRLVTDTYTATNRDQDTIVADLLARATTLIETAQPPGTFTPGSVLPLQVAYVNPDGTARPGLSGNLVTVTYPGSSPIDQQIDALAVAAGGFDYDVAPLANPGGTCDLLRVWYPQQGFDRRGLLQPATLMYDASITALQRTVDSSTYANYVRTVGNNGSSDPAAAQLYASTWTTDANNVTVNPVGLWMYGLNAPSVTDGNLLAAQGDGYRNLYSVLIPTYTVTLRPGFYQWGIPNMGDTVALIVNKGRLAVNTFQRILGITYTIGDDGSEDVVLTLGRPAATLGAVMAANEQDIDELVRR